MHTAPKSRNPGCSVSSLFFFLQSWGLNLKHSRQALRHSAIAAALVLFFCLETPSPPIAQVGLDFATLLLLLLRSWDSRAGPPRPTLCLFFFTYFDSKNSKFKSAPGSLQSSNVQTTMMRISHSRRLDSNEVHSALEWFIILNNFSSHLFVLLPQVPLT